MEQPSTRTPRPKPRRTDRPRLPRPARADAPARRTGPDRATARLGTRTKPEAGKPTASRTRTPAARPQRRPGKPGATARELPSPRLTGIGCGLFSMLVMLAAGTANRILLDASTLGYGLVFLVVCAVTALWVRRSDLASAPISAPIAFTAGLIVLSGDTGGRLMGVFTSLALQAGWLYGGTLLAALIVLLRGLTPARRPRP